MDVVSCAALALVQGHLLAGRSRFLGPATPPLQTTILLFLLQYIALKVYRVFLYHRYFSPLRHVPGPTNNHFLFGQALNLIRADSPTALYVQWMRQHPEAPFIRYLTWANTEVLVPNDIGAHKEVLHAQCYSFSKAKWFLRVVKEVAGHGLILMEGDEHRAHRRMLNGPFSLKNIRRLESIFQSKARDICTFFDQCIASNDGRTGAMDCTTTFSKAILDIMGSAILGIDLDYVKPGDDALDASPQGRTDAVRGKWNFYDAYDIFFAPSAVGKMLLVANCVVPVRWLPLEANREFLSAMGWLNDMLRSLIRDRYRQVAQAVSSGKYESRDSRDLVTFIVEESLLGGVTEGIGENEFLGHLLEFMAAGHDTSANTLSWSLYVLATHADIQTKLREEVNTLPASPTYAQLERLPYLENFSKEVLRMYCPATTYHREADKDVVVENVRIPQGTLVDLCPAALLLNPRIWGADVDEFDPSRWDRLQGDQLSPYASAAFSNGPRICIGRQFALFEIKTLLAEMVRGYRFVGVDKPWTVENPSFTLRPAGLEVRFEKINAR